MLAALLFPTLYTARAVHNDNLFELGPGLSSDEGGLTNILGDGVVSNGPDWSDLFTSSGTLVSGALATFGGIAGAFLPDDNSQKSPKDNTVFVVSSKNQDPISAWSWGTSSVPPKDEFLRAYAYGTVNVSNSHLVIYTGLERLNATGNSHVDFQFFQDQVHLVNGTGGPSPPCGDANKCSFAGTRITGDILASVDFSTGGTFPHVSIFEWDGSTFVLKGENPSGVGCNAADTVCGFVNTAPIKAGPWSSGHLDTNELTEFGVDVTGLFGFTPCVSTVFGATRSTGESLTGTLKDFAGPTGFPVCDARIAIAPNAVNEVGATHTFTVTFSKLVAGVPSPVPDGTIVTVTLTPANGAVVMNVVDNCGTTGTVGGTCTVSFKSNSAGAVTGTATGTVTIGGVPFTRTTNGSSGNSPPAVKRFVDAFITIAPNDVNSIFEQHTFKATVQQAKGLLSAPPGTPVFENAPDGTSVALTLTDLFGASHSLISDTCANPPGSGTVSGMCTVTFTSPTAGNVTGHASVTLTIDGVTVTRSTDGLGRNSANALKKFVSGSLSWSKIDSITGQLLGGATFQFCRTANLDTSTNTFVSITPICNTVVDNNTPSPGTVSDKDATLGKFKVDGLRLGSYTVQETVAPPGFAPDSTVVTAILNLSTPDVTLSHVFDNERPILKFTDFGYHNSPTSVPNNGVISGTVTYTVTIKNFGTASASLHLKLDISTASLGGGSISCSPSCNVDTTFSLAAGSSQTVTLTVDYTNAPSGAQITATLNADYSLNGLTRQVNGSPATITFTVQAQA